MKTIYIIIPCYNSNKTLKRCLDSIINNSYEDMVVICIDDGSSDDTLPMCHNYAKQDKRVTVIHKENGGPSSARNTGLDYIKDKPEGYVTFIDSDDWVDKDYFSTLVNLMETNNVDIVCSSFYYASQRKSSRAFCVKDDIVLSSFEALCRLFEDDAIKSMSHHKLFKSFLWNDVRYPNDLFFLEDTATIFKSFIKANRILLTNYCGYYYNQENNNSIMRSDNTCSKIASGWKALKYVYKYDFEGYSNEEKKTIKQLTTNLLADNFLELYPRYNPVDDYCRKFKKCIIKDRIIKNFKPTNKKQLTKKLVFLTLPFLYRRLFKWYNLIRAK